MGKKKKSDDCCEKYKKKPQFCSDCPLRKSLKKKKRRKLIAKHSP